MWRFIGFFLLLPVLWVALSTMPCPAAAATPCGGYGPPCTPSGSLRPSRTGTPPATVPVHDCAPSSPQCELPRTGEDNVTTIVATAAVGGGALFIGGGLFLLSRRRRAR